jgi:SET domain-containing protein
MDNLAILDKIYISNSKITGLGVFAKIPIKKNEIVWQDSNYHNSNENIILSFDEIFGTIERSSKLEEGQFSFFLTYMYQIDDDKFIGAINLNNNDKSLFINHSCDPNVYFKDNYTICAVRDIEVDEEVTFDYGTTDSHPCLENYINLLPHYKECLCSSNKCRKKITSNDWKLPELYDKLIPYLKRKKDAL